MQSKRQGLTTAEALGISSYVNGSEICSSNEEFIKLIYEYLSGSLPTDLTEYEICDFVLDCFNVLTPEDVTYDICLNLLAKRFEV